MYDYTQNPLYNPMINPYLNAQQPYRQQPKQEVVKVNGENGARAFPIGANSSALLLDESGVIVWLVTTDGAGYKTVAPFDISPHQIAPQPDFHDLETRIARLEGMIENVNASNSANAQRTEYTAFTESSARTAPADDFHAEKRRQPASAYAADDAAKQSSNGESYGVYTATRERPESRL